VDDSPPPFRVKKDGTPGRKPTDPRHVARCVLLKALTGGSYDMVHDLLCAWPGVCRSLGFESPPKPTTVQGLVKRIPQNTTAKAKGSAAWKRMARRWRKERRAMRCMHRRRTVVEGLIGAFRRRFGAMLSRVVVWNAIAAAYHLHYC
jgi:hypothetical protein